MDGVLCGYSKWSLYHGYNIYAWFLLVSTAGIPVAVAKQVAKYNTMREEEHSFALIRSFFRLY